MAQDRKSEQEVAQSSSSAEEEEASSEEQEGSESESEAEEEPKTLPTTPPVTKKPSVSKKPETSQTPLLPKSPSSDESGSESASESESDSPPEKTRKLDPNIKPIATKPMEDPLKSTKKPRSKPRVPTSPTPAKSNVGAKRPAENETKESKRVKRKVADPEDKKTTRDDPKKQLFQRLWSEDDEIAILKGMIEYTAKKGSDPVADMNAFLDFIKKSLHVDVSKTQLADKVRRLKKKYENNFSKEIKGKDRILSKPHEQKAYELSKKIWVKDVNSEGGYSTKVNGTAKKNQNQRGSISKSATSKKAEENHEIGISSPEVQNEVATMEVEHNVGTPQSVQLKFNRSIGDKNLEEVIVRDGLDLIVGPKKIELEEKWKKLTVQEVELFLKRVDLVREQTKLVLDAMKSEGH